MNLLLLFLVQFLTVDCFWQRANLRLYVLGRIKQLRSFDGQTVTEVETASALRCLLSSRVSVAMLLSHSRTDQNEPKSLDLRSTAEVITCISRSDHMKRSYMMKPICTDRHCCVGVVVLC